MDIHLDRLLNLPGMTVEFCTYEDNIAFLELRFLSAESDCPHCHHSSGELHQNRPILLRDLSVFSRFVYLQVPRRQFYCSTCQKYFTERLTFADWERRYTQRYESHIYERVKATCIEQVCREEELSWDRVQGIFSHQFEQKKTTTGVE